MTPSSGYEEKQFIRMHDVYLHDMNIIIVIIKTIIKSIIYNIKKINKYECYDSLQSKLPGPSTHYKFKVKQKEFPHVQFSNFHNEIKATYTRFKSDGQKQCQLPK